MREQQASRRAAYPPLTVRRIAPPPGLFQPPSGTPYNARSDANASRRISSDGSMYSQPSGDPRLSTTSAAQQARPRRSELSEEQVIATREPAARILQERRAAEAAFDAQQRQVATPPRSVAAEPPSVAMQRSLQILQWARGDAEHPVNNRPQQYAAPTRPHQQAAAAAATQRQRSPAPATKSETEEEKEAREAREKEERIEAARKRFEKGRGFEDDEEFFAGHRRNSGSA
ncbi:hypothetical protein PG993_005545 [Apiospora rasikravindrae]|uniref:Uncharacterized protein n=1 Tax=Apiospora rasikravindrae TaxID=990691 RepID=A0ABR1TFV5_9PEZI